MCDLSRFLKKPHNIHHDYLSHLYPYTISLPHSAICFPVPLLHVFKFSFFLSVQVRLFHCWPTAVQLHSSCKVSWLPCFVISFTITSLHFIGTKFSWSIQQSSWERVKTRFFEGYGVWHLALRFRTASLHKTEKTLAPTIYAGILNTTKYTEDSFPSRPGLIAQKAAIKMEEVWSSEYTSWETGLLILKFPLIF